MKPLGRPLKPRADAAAQGDTWRPSFSFVALAAAIAAGGITYLVMAPGTDRQGVKLAELAPHSTNMPPAIAPSAPATVPPKPTGLWMQSASGAPTGVEREVNGDLSFINTPKGPVAVPKDRLVPPELAPEGLAVRRVAIPAPLPQPGPRP